MCNENEQPIYIQMCAVEEGMGAVADLGCGNPDSNHKGRRITGRRLPFTNIYTPCIEVRSLLKAKKAATNPVGGERT